VTAWLTDPFAYAFFGRAMVAGVLIGAMCGALSVFVVLRKMSYIGHGLAHAVLGGVAVGVVLGQDMYVGAVIATLLAALLIDRISRRRGLHADASIGIVTTAIFAIGVATLSLAPARVNIEAVLFGNILGVDRVDLLVAGGVGLAFLVALLVAYKPLVFTTFDPEVAAVHGVRVGVSEVVFNLLTAAVVVASVRVLGVLLIAAAVVVPGAFARLVSRSLGAMLVIATGVGITSSVAGLYASYHADVPSGPAIVLTATLFFLVAFVTTAIGGRRRRRRARRDDGSATLPGPAAAPSRAGTSAPTAPPDDGWP
jgi:ABC-type Mn2+/Zn2+ transport system permease subunit